MKKFFVLFSLLAVSLADDCGKFENASVDDKSVNLPWILTLSERTTGDVLCMGTLISNQHVLIGKFHEI